MTVRGLWTDHEAADATGGRLIGGGWSASGVSIDTRTLEPGDLFVALKDQRDGHDFAQAAIDKGAAACLVSREDACDGPRLLVEDVQAALEALGAAARERSPALRVGVTGSVGKTTVKDALGQVFSAAGAAHWSVKSYNNHWGVPLTLSRLPRASERAVFEMGMNHAGEISRLTAQVRPRIAAITAIAPAHLENLGSMEGIARAKAEIYEGLEPDGVAILPADTPYRDILIDGVKRSGAAFLIDFGTAEGAAVRVLALEPEEEGARARLDVMGRAVELRLQGSGAHHAVNAACVLAASVASGVDLALASEVIERLAPGEGRGAAIRIALPNGGEVVVLDDSYNANPASMAAALGVLKTRKPGPGGRRIAVLGEMLELGAKAERMHAEMAGAAAEAGAEIVIGVGPLARALTGALPGQVDASYAADPETAVDALTQRLRDGDVVLIKGSNASGVHRIVARLRDMGAAAASET